MAERQQDAARAQRVTAITAVRLARDLTWFRIRGYGLWLKWGRGPDLFTTRRTAHYLGRLRWKVLRPSIADEFNVDLGRRGRRFIR